MSYVVLVPVKPVHLGKSRLEVASEEIRARLARAFCLDTVGAAMQSPVVREVLAVTDDFRLATQLRDLGCAALPDGVSDDLNETLRQAAAEAVRRHPGARVAALCADLPALRTEELDAALEAMPAAGAGFVADRQGTGTTLYAAAAEGFAPAFGEESARAHRVAGAVEVGAPLPGLRHDVDRREDLLGLGGRGLDELRLGMHTTAVLGPDPVAVLGPEG